MRPCDNQAESAYHASSTWHQAVPSKGLRMHARVDDDLTWQRHTRYISPARPLLQRACMTGALCSSPPTWVQLDTAVRQHQCPEPQLRCSTYHDACHGQPACCQHAGTMHLMTTLQLLTPLGDACAAVPQAHAPRCPTTSLALMAGKRCIPSGQQTTGLAEAKLHQGAVHALTPPWTGRQVSLGHVPMLSAC
jgi:hypothetical protein